MAESYISVGKLGKPHGIGGAFRFLLLRELKNKKKIPKYFLLDSCGIAAPHFIRKIDWTAENEGLVTFEEFKTPEAAKQVSGRDLQLLEKDVALYFKKEDNGINDLLGYMAFEETKGEIGRIDELIETPGQLLLNIESKGVLIPLVDEFVVKINKRKKEILFRLPEGLLDL